MTDTMQQLLTLSASFFCGMIIGGLIIYIASPSRRKQQSLRKELQNTKNELDKHQRELAQHFADCAQLLDNMAGDFRQLYQQMAKNSDSLLNHSALHTPKGSYSHPMDKSILGSTDRVLNTEPPKDY